MPLLQIIIFIINHTYDNIMTDGWTEAVTIIISDGLIYLYLNNRVKKKSIFKKCRQISGTFCYKTKRKKPPKSVKIKKY
jgi:hypothetical protein